MNEKPTYYDHVRVFSDGDKRCAVFYDFINIQESACGFGNNDAEAIADLAQCVSDELVKLKGEKK